MRFEDKFYAKALQQMLQDSLSDGFLCDVTLVVDGHEFQAHKIVLSAASPYFRLMFNTNSSFIEAKQCKVNLFGIDGDAFGDILTFIYSSHIEITDENVYPLMEAANLLQIYALRIFIGFHLQNSLAVENCLRLYSMARLYEYHDLARNAFHFVLTNFSNIMEKDEFLELPYEILLEIVSSKLLNINSEESLYEYVLKWIKADIEKRKPHLDSLMSNINLNLISKENLIKLKTDPLVTTTLKEKIEEVTKYILKRSNPVQKNYCYKSYRHKEEKPVIFAIGGESSGKASQNVECYTLGYDKWKYLVPEFIIKRHETEYTNVLPPLRYARYHAAYASDNYNVYIVGGKNSMTFLDECEVFNVRTNQWKCFNRFPVKLYASAAAFFEGELVVVGGLTVEGVLNKMWKLNEAHNSWVPMPPLNSPRYFHGAVAVRGYIFALGGFNNTTDAALRTCERFDPGCNKWFEIASMHEARASFGCVAVDEYIYVFGGTFDKHNCLKSVEKYNTFTNEWSYEDSMTFPRHSFSVAVFDYDIYCLGGSDCIHFLDSVEKFSLKTKRWHRVHSMQVSRLAPAAAALSVPYMTRK